MKRSWIKLYIEMLDDPQMGRLEAGLWRRATELFLLAGANGNDGLLPPIPDMAWKLRVPVEELSASLQALAEAGVVQETPRGWLVNHFAETQSAMPVEERMRRYRERKKEATKRNETGNEAAEVDSSSTSTSDSVSQDAEHPDSLEEGVPGEVSATHPPLGMLRDVAESAMFDESSRRTGQGQLEAASTRGGSPPNGGAARTPPRHDQPLLPATPAEAMLHPDVRVFTAATGGRIPGLREYRTVIETVRFLRAREKLDDPGLAGYLKPYWLAWSGRKRLDGRPYDPANLSWLTEWALNGHVPPNPQLAEGKKPAPPRTRAEVIREVARRKHGPRP
jgi:hypothetical protein